MNHNNASELYTPAFCNKNSSDYSAEPAPDAGCYNNSKENKEILSGKLSKEDKSVGNDDIFIAHFAIKNKR
ncbi:hypothetical protein [Niabella terrae]